MQLQIQLFGDTANVICRNWGAYGPDGSEQGYYLRKQIF